MLKPPARPRRRRPPRRETKYRVLAEAVADALARLDRLDRQAPLSDEFAARIAGLRFAARGRLARVGPALAPAPFGPGPVTPGAALVTLLKLQLVLAEAAPGCLRGK